MSQRILITGAQGFVGRYLVDWIVRNRDDTVILGVGRSPRRDDAFTHSLHWRGLTIPAPLPTELVYSSVSKNYSYLPIDISDVLAVEAVVREFAPTHVIHMASGLRGDLSEKLFRTNVEGTIALLEAIAKSGITQPCVVIGSSGGVYGLPRALPLNEDDECAPIDLYSVSKLAAEHAARVVARPSGMSIIVARLFNLIGPGQDERHVAGRFASQLSAGSRSDRTVCVTVGDLRPTRDFIDVRDAASAIMLVANSGLAGAAYNVATGVETSIAEVLRMTFDASGLQGLLDVVQSASVPAGLLRHVGNISKLTSLGYQPKHDVESSIRDLMTYYTATVSAAASRIG